MLQRPVEVYFETCGLDFLPQCGTSEYVQGRHKTEDTGDRKETANYWIDLGYAGRVADKYATRSEPLCDVCKPGIQFRDKMQNTMRQYRIITSRIDIQIFEGGV